MREKKYKIKKDFLIAAVFITVFINFLTFAQTGKVSGKVTDKASGDPLPGVNVQIVDLTAGGATDFEGDYYILNIPPGIYSVKASLVGYKTLTQTDVQVSINHTTKLDFQMEETVLQIGEDITIIAERPPVERDETSTRHFVTSEEISTRPVTQLTDILNTLPGIDADAQGELSVRRGSLDQVAFLIDGMRASNPLNYAPYTNINLTSIQELEIITGGFNAEYGEAQSGVFNIITKEGSDNFTTYSELRWTPPGKPHWGTALFDYSTTKYWENTHARHLQWWIDNPNQWVDPNGTPGNDPNSIWTPQQAYQNYIDTHQPLTNYTNESTYQGELSLGGPLILNNLFFFVTGKYRSQPPVTGNVFRKRGTWFDGTGKLTYKVSPNVKFTASTFYGEENSIVGMEYINAGWAGSNYLNKYAYYDFPGYPEMRTNGQTLQLTHVLGANTFYQIQLSRVFRLNSQSTFPGDEAGWEEGGPVKDYLRVPISEFPPLGYTFIGMNTTGYYYRGEDKNSDFTLAGDYITQINKNWQLKTGGDFTYYELKRFQEAKAFSAIERSTYHPYEGNVYAQSKLEFEGLIMNIGLRYDFYNPNDKKYLDPFDPFDLYAAAVEGREPSPKTEPTKTFGQLSPRIGISHPISENTVLHFSYGHFFQRANFGDYGEGYFTTGILNTYLASSGTDVLIPYNLGNRDLKPRKTVAYELGVEHNIEGIVVDVTAFYKDISKTIRTVTIRTQSGKYLTSGNSNYADAKGVEISFRKPLSDYWGGYLNYTFSTGIAGRSGDPDILYAPGVPRQAEEQPEIGDYVLYDPARLKFGITLVTPADFSFLFGILSNMQFSLDYQVYYSQKKDQTHTISEGGLSYIRPADINADFRIRKEIDFGIIRPALFLEIHNVFNNRWVNVDLVQQAQPTDRIQFINSGFSVFPEKDKDGAPFPDILSYRNLPRQVIFGFSVGL